jgi:hypothetical protein
MKLARKSVQLKGIAFTLAYAGYSIISLLGFISYVLIGNTLTANVVCIFLSNTRGKAI